MSARQDAYIAELVLGQPGTVAAAVVGSVVLGVLGVVVARWRGWSPGWTASAGCGLALAFAVTLARPGGELVTTDPIGLCLHNEFSLTGSLARLNLVMLVPFAFFATLATRAPLLVLGAAAAFSGGVELVQAATGVGVCEAQDFLNNTVGAFGAVLVAWLLTAAAGGPGPGSAGRPARGAGRRGVSAPPGRAGGSARWPVS